MKEGSFFRAEELRNTGAANRPTVRPRDSVSPDGAQYSRDLRTWSDGKRRQLESCLNDIMIGLVQAAEAVSLCPK